MTKRKFKTADYDKTLDLQISLRDVLPLDHLVHFIVDVIAQLDLSKIYNQYSDQGAPPYAPELMLGLLFYGYATGVFSSRKIERATYEVIPFRFIAGDMHPDHATIAHFRKQFLAELAIDAHLQAEVNELFDLAKAADGGQLPTEMNIPDEIERRQQQRERLAEAKKVLEARAQAGYEVEKAEYDAKMQARAEKEAKNGRKLRGRPPKPPTPGPCDKDQYNFTDPESRIMKNATNSGFDQHYNVQVVVEHDSRLIVGNWLCDHTNDKQAALPTIDTVPPELGQPKKANLDTGYFSESNIAGLEERGFDPYIATGRSPHHQGWRAFFGDNLDPLPDGASVKEQMAYKLRTEIGNALYRLRKSTVEPVIGIIKEVLGFRQFSLRGLCATGGEWTLVCLAYNLKRMHTLQIG